jgi:hypothetical protein
MKWKVVIVCRGQATALPIPKAKYMVYVTAIKFQFHSSRCLAFARTKMGRVQGNRCHDEIRIKNTRQ